MPIDLEDYEKWAEEYKANGGEPCIARYLHHLVYKDANSDPKHVKNNQSMVMVTSP